MSIRMDQDNHQLLTSMARGRSGAAAPLVEGRAWVELVTRGAERYRDSEVSLAKLPQSQVCPWDRGRSSS